MENVGLPISTISLAKLSETYVIYLRIRLFKSIYYNAHIFIDIHNNIGSSYMYGFSSGFHCRLVCKRRRRQLELRDKAYFKVF